MKLIIYYLLLLVFIALVTGYIISGGAGGSTMAMPQMVTVSGLLILYVIGLSLVGEVGNKDERDTLHRDSSNRAALIAGSVVLSLGVLYQLFTHRLDYWLLVGLIVINLTKITSLIYLNYKK